MNNREWLNQLATSDVSALTAWMDAEHVEDASSTLDGVTAALNIENAMEYIRAELDKRGIEWREWTRGNVETCFFAPGNENTCLCNGGNSSFMVKVSVGKDHRSGPVHYEGYVVSPKAAIDASLGRGCLNDDFTLGATSAAEVDKSEHVQKLDELDSRENLEADIRASLGFTTKDVFAWLDRQAAITEQQIERKWCCYEGSVQSEIDKLQQQVDNLAHDLAESERFREEMREELSIAYDYAHDLLARRDRGLA